MIVLDSINIEEFKVTIYPEYLKIFTEEEKKSLDLIESLVSKGIMQLIKITSNSLFVGFMIINKINGSKYIQLDYFAILPKYQNKGYGTISIKLLKKVYSQYNGIFVEVEKLGLGYNEEENKLRQKRVSFYEKLHFYKLNFDFIWFNTLILTPYILPISNGCIINSVGENFTNAIFI